MPEGPEIYILHKAINKYYGTSKTLAKGKHLYVLNDSTNLYEDWSFGLSGTVFITEDNVLTKNGHGWANGSVKLPDNTDTEKLGLDWLTYPKEGIKKEVDKWINSKKKLAGLMLDQSLISGIGIAWGSEILHKAGLKPDLRACDQNLTCLAEVIYEVREKSKNIYDNYLDSSENYKDFINKWFINLYEIRDMSIYKKGKKIEVLGRNWWV